VVRAGAVVRAVRWCGGAGGCGGAAAACGEPVVGLRVRFFGSMVPLYLL
jgi:hypothetical protein